MGLVFSYLIQRRAAVLHIGYKSMYFWLVEFILNTCAGRAPFESKVEVCRGVSV